ncbi:hypothetical protein PHLGIDRAFT_75338 [Phlebiopsis gigantea 11061_1 CR5-6]|uniref:Cytochrome P450 monooxygenase n=1 Tax=Phlebiopsis gigantea (strain 11061_1 CR5-6) TaxID=745531 RepID=A0A0C3PGF0_PHLG1|nr:hypothetical protein PHLGIDRAFT_75338 [Phlebiopsis gigantea 11061_1 CR5-6]
MDSNRVANDWSHLDTRLIVLVPVIILGLAYTVPYFSDRYGIRRYPGPLLAKISNLWFANQVFHRRNIVAVHEMHEQYGTFVRITPNQVSIADPDALQAVYGYSSGAQKGDLYEGFVVFAQNPSMFATRMRDVHSRKRKYLSHVMSMKSIQELEPIILHHQQVLVQRWDALCAEAVKHKAGVTGSCNWKARDGRVWFNCMPWYHFEAFDIIGDLAFGLSLGMLESAEDAAPVVVSQKAAMDSYFDSEKAPVECTTVPAVKTIDESVYIGLLTGTLSFLRPCRPLLAYLPPFKASMKSRALLAKMAVSAVARRLASGESRPDFLTKLITATDDNGHHLPAGELSAEASSFLVAGSDTTSNSLGAITYYLARTPAVQAKLQKELDAVLGSPSPNDEAVIATYDQIKNIAYLQDVINEGMRLHSTAGIGLPRIVPESGLTIAGMTFVGGTEVSCPTYTIHRLKSVWGPDADEFVPDRWSRGDRAELSKYFVPFSIGPRSVACIGRHLAMMELTICIATVFHRFDLALEDPNGKARTLKVYDAFLRKPASVFVGMKRRV